MKAKMKAPKSVDEYLLYLPDDKRIILEKVRAAIKKKQHLKQRRALVTACRDINTNELLSISVHLKITAHFFPEENISQKYLRKNFHDLK